MCVAFDDDEGSGGSEGTTPGGNTYHEHDVVVAPRIGINMDVYDSVDWETVQRAGIIGVITGAWTGPGTSALVGTAAAATAIETQGIRLEDLFEIRNDMIVIPGLPAPYLPMY